jgi:hypothetical protein
MQHRVSRLSGRADFQAIARDGPCEALRLLAGWVLACERFGTVARELAPQEEMVERCEKSLPERINVYEKVRVAPAVTFNLQARALSLSCMLTRSHGRIRLGPSSRSCSGRCAALAGCTVLFADTFEMNRWFRLIGLLHSSSRLPTKSAAAKVNFVLGEKQILVCNTM